MSRAPTMEAPVGLLPLPRPLMTGEVLDAAFRLFRAGILRTLPYSALVVLILEIPKVYATLFMRPQYLPVSNAVVFLMAVPILGVMTLRLNAVASGLRPRFRHEIRVALRRWLPAIVATLGAFAIPVALLVLGPAFTNGLPTEAVLFLSIPLFWPTVLFVVALPAFWCGGCGPVKAIARSVSLASRRSWRMVGAILAALCVVGVFVLLVIIIAGLMSPLFGRADLFLSATVEALMFLVVGAFGVPYVLAVLIVAHQDLELRDKMRRVRT